MKIVLVSPCDDVNEWKNTRSVFVFPPMALACLKSVTPSEHELICIDETFNPVDLDDDVDLVGISILTANAARGFELAAELRGKNFTVVLGGPHVTLCPEESQQYADAIVIGEGEVVWPQLLEDYQKGVLKKVYQSEPLDLTLLPTPDHSHFNPSHYRIPYTVIATRGCPFNCSFCSTTIIFGRKYRAREIPNVIDEIASFPKKFFIFLDDNLFFNRKYAKELMKALIPLKKRWVAQADFTVAEDEELLKLCYQAGCMAFLIGFETVSKENFINLGKPVKTIDDYKKSITTIHKEGILIQGSFIFGFDGDDHATFKKTVDFAKEIGIDTANFCSLTPTPGTPLFEQFEKEGRILSKNWRYYTRQKVVFQPKKLTPRELAEGRFWAYKNYYSFASMLRRMPFKFPHFFWFWLYNFSFRIGVRRASKIEKFINLEA